MEWVACISILVSSVVSIVHAVIAYKKYKEPPKDPVWEAALKLTISSNCVVDADEFARNYQELAAFKANGCSLGGFNSLHNLVKNHHSE